MICWLGAPGQLVARVEGGPTTTTAELTYALDAVEQIATHGARWAEDYLYDPHTNEFVHATWDAGWRGVVQEWFAQVGRVEAGREG